MKVWKGSGAPERSRALASRAASGKGAFGFSCEVCGAKPGQACRDERNVVVRTHTVRRMKYKASR